MCIMYHSFRLPGVHCVHFVNLNNITDGPLMDHQSIGGKIGRISVKQDFL